MSDLLLFTKYDIVLELQWIPMDTNSFVALLDHPYTLALLPHFQFPHCSLADRYAVNLRLFALPDLLYALETAFCEVFPWDILEIFNLLG